MKMSIWTYKGKVVDELPDDCEAFVYLITNTTNNRKYVGKKLAKFKVTRPPLKGKKRKRRSIVESDWKKYYGSNAELQDLVEQSGPDNFNREILKLCKTKGECSYYEMKYQFMFDVLLKPDEYYNSFIGGKIHRKHILGLQSDENMIE